MFSSIQSIVSLLLAALFSAVIVSYLLYKYARYSKISFLPLSFVFCCWWLTIFSIFLLSLDITSAISVSHANNNNTTNDTNTNNSTYDIIPQSNLFIQINDVVLLHIWRVVYWLLQVFTWIIVPLSRHYLNSGKFTFKGRTLEACVVQLCWSILYIFCFVVFVIYLAVRDGNASITWLSLKTILTSLSNAWGTILFTVLLGYGLVYIPKRQWQRSYAHNEFERLMFKLVESNEKKTVTKEKLDVLYENCREAEREILPNNTNLRKYLQIIVQKFPHNYHGEVTIEKSAVNNNFAIESTPNITDQSMANYEMSSTIAYSMRKVTKCFEKISDRLQDIDNYMDASIYTNKNWNKESSLCQLHRQVIRLHLELTQVEYNFNNIIKQLLFEEDIIMNDKNHKFIRFLPRSYNHSTKLWLPVLEWFWFCRLRPFVLKIFALFLFIISFIVLWSEVTFLYKDPPLSIFALIITHTKAYFYLPLLEIVICCTLLYVTCCSFVAVFKFKFTHYCYFEIYHTNAQSLLFSANFLSKLAGAILLNFLAMSHLNFYYFNDKNDIKLDYPKTSYTSIMGDEDLLRIFTKYFYVYFPLVIILTFGVSLCGLGRRIIKFCKMSNIFIDEEFVAESTNEGKQLFEQQKAVLKQLWKNSNDSDTEALGESSLEISRSWLLTQDSTQTDFGRVSSVPLLLDEKDPFFQSLHQKGGTNDNLTYSQQKMSTSNLIQHVKNQIKEFKMNKNKK